MSLMYKIVKGKFVLASYVMCAISLTINGTRFHDLEHASNLTANSCFKKVRETCHLGCTLNNYIYPIFLIVE